MQLYNFLRKKPLINKYVIEITWYNRNMYLTTNDDICICEFSDNATVSVYQKVEVIKKHGLDYISPVQTNSTIHVGGPKANLKFDGNSELGKSV